MSNNQQKINNNEIDLEFAKLDIARKERTGYPETVFCQNKTICDLIEIFSNLYKVNGEVLGTRATMEQAEAVKKVLPEVVYESRSRTLRIEKCNKKLIGNIAICTAGTADINVAEEASITAQFFGNRVNKFYDVGVSGLHRIVSRIDDIRQANVVIVVAGMEAALASVIGGLVANPIIAVPTSVGYGANFEGLSALLGMLNSCANGVSVVNIDNGYGAGYLASQINRLACKE